MVWYVVGPLPWHCSESSEKTMKKQWEICVRTARHVVFNNEEAKITKIDFFFDAENCDRDGRMKSVWGVRVAKCFPNRDCCFMLCTTSDEDLVQRIQRATLIVDNARKSATYSLRNQHGEGRGPMLIISHPHGQSKKITVGKLREDTPYHMTYSIPTCPGSSGAPVCSLNLSMFHMRFPSVHSGTNNETSTDQEGQINCGFQHIESLNFRRHPHPFDAANGVCTLHHMMKDLDLPLEPSCNVPLIPPFGFPFSATSFLQNLKWP